MDEIMNELILESIEFLKMAKEEATHEADVWRINWHIEELGRFHGTLVRAQKREAYGNTSR